MSPAAAPGGMGRGNLGALTIASVGGGSGSHGGSPAIKLSEMNFAANATVLSGRFWIKILMSGTKIGSILTLRYDCGEQSVTVVKTLIMMPQLC